MIGRNLGPTLGRPNSLPIMQPLRMLAESITLEFGIYSLKIWNGIQTEQNPETRPQYYEIELN